jgi:hypothetical protein
MKRSPLEYDFGFLTWQVENYPLFSFKMAPGEITCVANIPVTTYFGR